MIHALQPNQILILFSCLISLRPLFAPIVAARLVSTDYVLQIQVCVALAPVAQMVRVDTPAEPLVRT